MTAPIQLADQSHGVSGVVTDIAWEPRIRFWSPWGWVALVMMVVMFGSIGITLFAILATGWPMGALVPVLAVGCGAWPLGVVFWWQRRARRRTREFLRQECHRAASELLAEAHRSELARDGRILSTEVIRHVAATGGAGLTLRLAPPAEFWPIAPLGVDFEPVSLDESDQRFIELHEGLGGTPAAPPATRRRWRPPPPRPGSTRHRVGRFVRSPAGYTVLFMLLFVMPQGFGQLASGGNLGVAGIILSVGLLALVVLVASGRMSGMTWQVMPGAVSCQERKGNRRVYLRTESVLVAWRASAKLWVLRLSDGGLLQVATATRAEIDLFLRAWISPASAQTIEMAETSR